MFHKNTEKLESFIGEDTTFKGNIDTKGTLRIDGRIEGDITADWAIVGEKALVKGNINARGIVVGGRVDGNLKAKEIVEVRNKGQVYGEIFSSKLSVSEGAIFDGKSSVHREDSKVVELQAKEKSK